jgi:GMP synthase (glutamine-hydrolysing)
MVVQTIHNMIVIIDFGSQSTHLISRRLREISIASLIVVPEEFFEKTKGIAFDGIILSGGPASVYETDAPTIDKHIFSLGKPILGICYGQQLISHLLGGGVKPGLKKEYGPATVDVNNACPLFEGLPTNFSVWMSHGDEVDHIPHGFESFAVTDTIPHAAIANESLKVYGIQFHPEVVHTQFGLHILKNFAKICGLEPQEQEMNKEFVNEIIADIKDSLKDQQVIGAFSGGVDSSIASLLVHEAIGHNFTAVYIDSGLMREGETEQLQDIFSKHYKMNIKVVHAKERFLQNLQGITDPEQKRKIIGRTFIEVLDDEAKKLGATFLVQGTIYPDVIESMGTKHSKNIKSHHNVGGLPKDMKLTLVEPLRNFYKDEVRKLGTILDLPEEIVHRQPFPGPGLAVRIIGEVTDYNLSILRKADRIVHEEITNSGWDKKVWQAFAIFAGVKTTGVRGDNRAYGETIAIRAIEAKDAMSANFAKLPWEVLEKISLRIVTEVPEVNRVVYDITNKPPATMEWE